MSVLEVAPARPATATARPPLVVPRRRPDLTRWISPAVLVIAWQIASATGILPPRLLSSPSTLAHTTWHLVGDGELPQALAVSVQRVALGSVAGISAGLALGLVAGLSRWGERLLDPPLQMLRAVPFLGLVPMLILWFGIGELPKVTLVALGTCFPVYLNSFAGIRSTDGKLVEAASTLGLTRRQRIRHVVLPAALPQTLVGLRYALTVAWLSLIVAEQVNADAGIGYLINNAREFLQTDVIVVGLIVYALLGLLTDFLIRLAERRVLAWRRSFVPA
jgi:sulfonate transport system permease protein